MYLLTLELLRDVLHRFGPWPAWKNPSPSFREYTWPPGWLCSPGCDAVSRCSVTFSSGLLVLRGDLNRLWNWKALRKRTRTSFFRENKAWKTQFHGLWRSTSCHRFIRKVADGYLSEHGATYGRRSSVSGRWSNVGSARRCPSNGATRHSNLPNQLSSICL